ncbi:MAG: hypothetical protein Q8P20_07965 [bacterium]|nr:hypothetical protein [bacterium]MDZ4227877.1 hypothetical protein [Candidatus Levybacteria bacterium]
MKYQTYCNIKAKGRMQELELIAFAEMTGEEVAITLESIAPALRYEYEKLMETKQ